MARRGFKQRLKVTRESIERFCLDLKIVRMLTSPERPSSTTAETVSLISDDDEEKMTHGKQRPFMEKLDLSHVGPSNTLPDDEELQPAITTPRRYMNFDLPRSPRIETTASADQNVELRRLRRKSIESPRSFLNGLAGIESLPAVIAKKDNNVKPSQILLVSWVLSLTYSLPIRLSSVG